MTLEQMQKEGQTLLKPEVFQNKWSREHPHHAKVAQDIMDAMWEAQIKDLDQHTANTWKAAQEAVIETLKHYGVQSPTTYSLILTRHDLLLLLQPKK